MKWRPVKRNGAYKKYSLSRKLKDEKRINDGFETILNNLSLEEVIGLKLELASKAMGGKLFNIPLWSSLGDICKDAVIKYALSAARTRVEAGNFLGLSPIRFLKARQKYKVEEYFSEKPLDK